MKSIKYLLCLSPFFIIQHLQAIDYKEIKSIDDTICLHYNDSILFEKVLIIWQSYIIEDVIESDGSHGSQTISSGFVFECNEKKENWNFSFPALYKEFIKNNSDKLAFDFCGYTFCITDADLNSSKNDFIILQIKKTEIREATYYIDEKLSSNKEFKKFRDSLKEVEGTWFCGETSHGGMVGYNLKDEEGNIYKYKTVSENGATKTTITKSTPQLY
jgi:hypothetical protein